jgi:hypothetical protein
MAHLRNRALTKVLNKTLTWSPSIALIGMRQCGKTTLLKHLSNSYFSFDDDVNLAAAQSRQWDWLLSAKKPVALDEAQKSPELFNKIKLLVDENRRPGRFLLSGSVRFLGRRAIKESLTGRTAILELLPMGLAECHSRSPSDFFRLISKSATQASLSKVKPWASLENILHYTTTGGMPGVCFKRESAIRTQMWSSHFDTVLTRDFQLIHETRIPPSRLKELFAVLANRQGEPHDFVYYSRVLGASLPTTKKVLATFETLFLIRSHGETFFCEDMGLANFACQGQMANPRNAWVRWIFGEFLLQLSVQHVGAFKMEAYRSRGGVFVPIVVKLSGGQTFAFTFDDLEAPTEKSIKSLGKFAKSHARTLGIAIHLGTETKIHANGTICLPITKIV